MSEPAIDLRPMSIGEILDRSFRLYRANFVLFFGIMLVVNAVMFLWQIVGQEIGGAVSAGAEPDPAAIAAFIAVNILNIVLSITVGTTGQGALTVAVSERALGSETSVGSAYRRILPRLFTLIVAGLIYGLLVGLGMVLCIAPGVYFYFAFFLTSVVVVLENRGALSALSRSRELMREKTEKGFLTLKSNTAKAAVILLIIFIVSIAVGMLTGIPAIIIAVMSSTDTASGVDALPFALRVVFGLVQAVVNSAVAPLYTTAIVLLYYDIRIRFEGFDLEMMARALGEAPADEGGGGYEA